MQTVILSVSEVTAAQLRERATALNVPYSALADVCMKESLAAKSDAELEVWLARRMGSRPGARARHSISKNERIVLETLERMVKAPGGGWRFSHTHIAQESGLRYALAYAALKQLLARGKVAGGDSMHEGLDAWGRPRVSYWTLTGPDGQPVKNTV